MIQFVELNDVMVKEVVSAQEIERHVEGEVRTQMQQIPTDLGIELARVSNDAPSDACDCYCSRLIEREVELRGDLLIENTEVSA